MNSIHIKKTILPVLIILFSLQGYTQVIDNFSTRVSQKTLTEIGKVKYEQMGSGIINNNRTVLIIIKNNNENQSLHFKIDRHKLIASIGYGLRSVIELRYGFKNPLNLHLNKNQNIHISYEGKSNFGRVYLQLFTKVGGTPHRAFWRGEKNTAHYFKGSLDANGNNKSMVLKIPLRELVLADDAKRGGNHFDLNNVNLIKIQFISSKSVGSNFALKKVWIE